MFVLNLLCYNPAARHSLAWDHPVLLLSLPQMHFLMNTERKCRWEIGAALCFSAHRGSWGPHSAALSAEVMSGSMLLALLGASLEPFCEHPHGPARCIPGADCCLHVIRVRWGCSSLRISITMVFYQSVYIRVYKLFNPDETQTRFEISYALQCCLKMRALQTSGCCCLPACWSFNGSVELHPEL